MIEALIFDCDGVLVDTERDGHRVGFNRAFAEMGIAAEWDVALYGKLLQVAGGKERMRAYFDEYGWPEGADTAEARDELIARLHKLKTEITAGLVAEGGLPLRPGVARLVDEAIAAGVKLGVCTTSNPKFIDAVLDLFGPERKAKFDFVHAGDVVAKKKPAPDIYLRALETLGAGPGGDLAPHECMVVEDSRNGLLAARGAGLPTLITTSTYTVDEDFTGAVKVVPELGDEPHVNIRLADLGELAAATAA
jgi:HAD superfamily hydrolase (TIGR01509 family)